MAQQPKLSSPRDIGIAINNALLIASRPEDFPIPESRLRRLSEYTAALVGPSTVRLPLVVVSTLKVLVAPATCGFRTLESTRVTAVPAVMAFDAVVTVMVAVWPADRKSTRLNSSHT